MVVVVIKRGPWGQPPLPIRPACERTEWGARRGQEKRKADTATAAKATTTAPTTGLLRTTCVRLARNGRATSAADGETGRDTGTREADEWTKFDAHALRTHLRCRELVGIAGDASDTLRHERLVQALRFLGLVQHHHLFHPKRSWYRVKTYHQVRRALSTTMGANKLCCCRRTVANRITSTLSKHNEDQRRNVRRNSECSIPRTLRRPRDLARFLQRPSSRQSEGALWEEHRPPWHHDVSFFG